MESIRVFSCFKAVLTRLLFMVHSTVAIWRVTVVKDEPTYWLLTVAMVLMIVELLVIIIKRKGAEWKWYCPSFLLYLLCVVPAIWVLELTNVDNIKNNRTSSESTNVSLSDLGVNFDFSITLSSGEWALYIEQALLVLLIIGRWLLPKGELTRDELSQLLLVYLSLAADIIDFFGIIGTFLESNGALPEMYFIYIIIGVWSWSLLQFTFVLTASKGRGKNMSQDRETDEQEAKRKRRTCCRCWGTEISSILTTVFLQDLPFFIVRMVSMIHFKLVNYTMVFFVSKNVLVLMLQFYRLVILHCENDDDDRVECAKNENSFVTLKGSNKTLQVHPTYDNDAFDKDEP